MCRAAVLPTPRRSFTKSERMRVYTAQEGLCEMCGKHLRPDFEVDHRIDIWFGGAHDLSNWRALCKTPCHRDKTASQAPVRAHVKRLIANENPETRPAPKMRSRPFQTHLTKGFDRVVRPRKARNGASR